RDGPGPVGGGRDHAGDLVPTRCRGAPLGGGARGHRYRRREGAVAARGLHLRHPGSTAGRRCPRRRRGHTLPRSARDVRPVAHGRVGHGRGRRRGPALVHRPALRGSADAGPLGPAPRATGPGGRRAPAGAHRVRGLLTRLAGAAGAGALLAVSFPPVGLWWASLLGIALLVVVLSPLRRPLRARTGALLGFVAGLVFFLILVPWVGLYVGAYAAWGLAVVEALYVAAFGAGAVVILAWGVAPGSRTGPRALGAVAGVAGWWSAWEWIRSSWPWGGFPWGRLAFGQADGPLLPLASLGGTPLLGFAVAAAGAALAVAGLLLSRRDRPVRGVAALLAVPVVTAGLVAAAGIEPAAAPADGDAGDPVDVAVVQGNVPRLGLDYNAQRRAVLDNHLSVTADLADSIDEGERGRPDLVLWPENASDISPLHDRRAGVQISELSRRVGAPILVGTVLPTGEGREATNSYLVWDGAADDPVVDRHDKRYIQPFGEWLPLREPLEALFPVARTAGHFVPGDGNGLV